MNSETTKIAVIRSYCTTSEYDATPVFEHGVEHWLEIPTKDISKYTTAVRNANRNIYMDDYHYILLEQSPDIMKFMWKDANEFLKKMEDQERKYREQKEKEKKNRQERKRKAEITRTTKQLKKLGFASDVIEEKIKELF